MSRTFLLLPLLVACASSGLDGTVRQPASSEFQNFRADITTLSANQGEWARMTLEVAPGTPELVVTIQGGTGDADLYLNFGDEPTEMVFECRPYQEGNAERCVVEAPAAGTWHIGLYASESFEDVGVDWEGFIDSEQLVGMEEYVLLNTIVGAVPEGQTASFAIDIEVGTSILEVISNGGEGDADLILVNPANEVVCQPQAEDSTERCVVQSPVSGQWTVELLAYTAYRDVAVSAVGLIGSSDLVEPSPGELLLMERPLSGCAEFGLPTNREHGALRLSWAGGDPGAAVTVEPVTSSDADYVTGTSGDVWKLHPEAGDWRVCTRDGATNIRLAWAPAVSIMDGYLDDSGASWDIEVPEGATSMLVNMDTSAAPTITVQRDGITMCRSTEGRCEIDYPVPGTWRVNVSDANSPGAVRASVL